MLHGAPILIVEDEPFIAMDLADAVRAADGTVMGPFATVTAALAVLDGGSVAGAVLDCNLQDGEVSPLAQRLLTLDVPFVVYTASALPKALERWQAGITLIKKPAVTGTVIERLAQLLKR